MPKFIIWLYNKPKSYLLHISFITALVLVYVIVGSIVEQITSTIVGTRLVPDWLEIEGKPLEYQIIFLIFLLLGAPLNSVIEELIFRAPLSVVGKIWPGHRVGIWVALVSSIIFGYIHGGLATIPAQGVLGMILCFSYMKCGGMEGKFWRPIGVTIAVHTLYNFVLLCVGLTSLSLELAAS
ncbi:MAG: CPBP family intramembrane glutamic endopeptidase [Patescibacteria group bacterium]